MKFEIDPNELTTEQRTHVATFITNWPVWEDSIKTRVDEERILGNISEEQRLDAEQKSDIEEAVSEIGAAAADNLNAIFGTPNIAEEMTQLLEDRKALVSDIMHNAVPLDKEGLPWDSRIHASTKTFIADGSWKLRRGVDPIEVATVKAQLKELMAVPTFVSIDDYSPTDVVQALGVPLPPAPVVFGVDLAAGTDTAVITQIPPAPKSIDQQPVTLTELIGRMSKAIAENRLTQANVAEICIKHGVSEFHLLSNRPDLLPLIDVDMKAMGV